LAFVYSLVAGTEETARILVIVAKNTPVTDNRTERALAYMIASSFGISVLAMIAVFIGRNAGIDFSSGPLLTVTVLPFVGLVLAAVLIIARIVVILVKRSRAAKDAAN
jgi:surface polysaccharide O-acyltransferase-like enzyme